jgi:hypothetical protein
VRKMVWSCLGIILAILLLAGQARLEAPPPAASPAQDLADFGVSDIEVRSVKALGTATINAEVSRAAGKGEQWPHEAVLVALKLVGADLKGSSKIIAVQTPAGKSGHGHDYGHRIWIP